MTRYKAFLYTKATAAHSRMQIEKMLIAFGADHHGTVANANEVTMAFRIGGRSLRFTVPMVPVADVEFDARHHQRTDVEKRQALERFERQRWRILKSVIYSKLLAIMADVSTVEEEFLANIVMRDGRTIAEHSLPLIAQAKAARLSP